MRRQEAKCKYCDAKDMTWEVDGKHRYLVMPNGDYHSCAASKKASDDFMGKQMGLHALQKILYKLRVTKQEWTIPSIPNYVHHIDDVMEKQRKEFLAKLAVKRMNSLYAGSMNGE